MNIKITDRGHKIYFNNKEYRSPISFDITSEKKFLEFEDYLISKGIKYEIKEEKIKEELIEEELIEEELIEEEPIEFSKYIMGCLSDIEDDRDYLVKSILKTSKLSIPLSKDYSSLMSPVKNQEQLGACVGFAVAAVKEYQEQQEYLNEISEGSKYRRKEKYYDLSEQWIYYKAKEIDPWPYEEGTSIRCALNQLCKIGVPPEKGWKYNDIEKGKPEVWAKSIARWGKGQEYYRINNLDELLYALVNVGPIVIGIMCFKEIFNPIKGVVSLPKNPDNCLGGHAICVTGYDKFKKLITFKNSWGLKWGNNGYGYLPFEYIENYMVDAWALIDTNIKNILEN